MRTVKFFLWFILWLAIGAYVAALILGGKL